MTIQDDAGRFSYGGLALTVYHSNIKSVPEYTADRRTVKWVRHTLRVAGWVLADPGGSTDLTMLDVRQRLTKPGLALVYQNKGFGSLNVNVSAVGAWDADHGPKPELITFAPRGDDKAAFVEWEVQTCIPECDDARYRFGIAELTWDTAQDIDADGYLEVRTKVHLEIPLTRARPGARVPNDHVDRYREAAVPPLPLGFQRARQDVQISADKRVLDATFVDKQLPVPLPLGVTTINVKHRLSNTVQHSQTVWKGSIAGDVTLGAGRDKANAYLIFLRICADRMLRWRQGQPAPGQLTLQGFHDLMNQAQRPAGQQQGRRHWLMMPSIEVEEDVFGRGSHFRLDYMAWTTGGLADALTRAGMWRPVPDTNFARFRVGQATDASVRGRAGYRERAEDAAIIDLCGVDRGGRLPEPGGAEPSPTGVVANTPRPQGGFNSTGWAPAPEESWVYYDAELIYTELGFRYARHKPMEAPADLPDLTANPIRGPGTNPPPEPLPDLNRNLITATATARQALATRGGGRIPVPAAADAEDVIHEVATPSPRVRVVVRAVRFGHRVPLPVLRSVGGRVAYRTRIVEAREKVYATYLNLPLWAVWYVIDYELAAPPVGSLPILANPLLGVSGAE